MEDASSVIDGGTSTNQTASGVDEVGNAKSRYREKRYAILFTLGSWFAHVVVELTECFHSLWIEPA